MPLDLRKYSSTVRVIDGAWGTELQARGLPAGGQIEYANKSILADAISERRKL